jgi:hypothetical protein
MQPMKTVGQRANTNTPSTAIVTAQAPRTMEVITHKELAMRRAE